MAKRSTNDWNSLTDERVEAEMNDNEFMEADQPKVETVRLRLMREVQLTTKGLVTGNDYHWFGAGSTETVDKRDLEHLLKRGYWKSCCGGTPSPYFEIMEA